MMQKRKTALVAAICTLVLICVFASTFFFSSLSYQTDRYRVTLPKEMDSADDLNTSTIESALDPDAELPSLTPQNVQEVILNLPHLEQYSATVTNTLYLDDGTTAIWRAVIYEKNGAQRVERFISADALPESYIFYNDEVYVWEHGSVNYWSSQEGAVSARMTAMIPSYLDVCALSAEEITETEIIYMDGVPCIRVVCGSENTEYIISMVTGLLEHVKYYENGEMVREVKILASAEEILDSMFALPGESVPIFSQQEQE